MKLRHVTTLFVIILLALPSAAAADSHKLLVLQSEGHADAATRSKIDAAIVKLAKTTEPQAAGGELNYTDAATAVGCKPESPTCKDEVMAMLSVDEIVITNVTPKPGGLEVAVQRVTKGGTSHDAKTMIPTGGAPDKLDGLAPLFGGKAPAEVAPPAPKPTPPPAPTPVKTTPTPPAPTPPAPAAITNTQPTPLENPSAPPPETTEPTPSVPPPTAIKAEPLPPPMTQNTQVDEPSGTRKTLEIAGIATGGGMVVVSFILWGAASSKQGDIDKAPVKTKADLKALKDLESQADSYATGGNILFIGGLVVGGISTYLYIRDRGSSSSASARLMPTLFDHGAGIAFSYGGSP